MSRYISAMAKGTMEKAQDTDFILSFYGPRGGSRSIEVLTVEEAGRLAVSILKRIANEENPA